MRVLVDTHVLLWTLLSPRKLSRAARELVRDVENVLHVSTASAWEIATKHRLGRLPEANAVVHHYLDHLRRLHADELVITSAHALMAGGFSQPHRDPFDRLLAAQCVIEGLPLVSNDEALQKFPITVIW